MLGKLREEAARLRPGSVQEYLRSRGWALQADLSAQHGVVVYEHQANVVEISTRPDFADYGRRMLEVVELLAELEGLDEVALLDEIARPQGDLIAVRVPPIDHKAELERRQRREALGWTPDDAAGAARIAFRWEVERCEREADDSRGRLDAQDRVLYAAALTAEEQRRADILADNAAQAAEDPVDAADLLRAQQRMADLAAPEVVDVPQPPNPVAKRCGTVLAKHWPGDTIMHIEVDGGGYVRVPVALLRAMLAAIDAQQPAPQTERDWPRQRPPFDIKPQLPGTIDHRCEPSGGAPAPERPEPRYKVGDWVRNVGNRKPWQITSAHWRNGWWGYADARHDAPESALTHALDPALHETARKTVAWLRGGPSDRDIAIGAHRQLPGAAEWDADYSGDYNAANTRWATQLEQLLGDAPRG